MAELAPGTVVDKYEVIDLVGRGATASVFRVRHQTLGTVLALKVLDAHGRSAHRRFFAEGKLLAALKHVNVVSVLDVIEVGESPGLVLEYVDGPTLEGLLREGRPTVPQLDELARGLLRGVRAAHRMGMIHRDLKPANVLLARMDDRYVPKIADFGLAKLLGDEGSKTRAGAMMGTPAYMAPEQLVSAKEADERADVWSLGVTLYELATGRRPFPSDDLVPLVAEIRAGAFPRPRELVPELPARIDEAIVGALRVDLGKRLVSVEALLNTWFGERSANPWLHPATSFPPLPPPASAVPVELAPPTEPTAELPRRSKRRPQIRQLPLFLPAESPGRRATRIAAGVVLAAILFGAGWVGTVWWLRP